MTELAQHRLTVENEKTGEITDKVLSYRLSSSYTTPTDEWEFTVYDDRDPASLRRRWQPLHRVKLRIDGELQVLGRIDETEGVGESSSAMSVRGRDHLAELVDGGADPAIKFSEGMDLGDAILYLTRPFGIDSLVGNWNLTRNLLTGRRPKVEGGLVPKDFKAARLQDFKVEPNMGTWEVLTQIVARHGFMGQSGGARNILAIVEPMYAQEPTFFLQRPGNILTGKAKRSYADAPTVTIATGKHGGSGEVLSSMRTEFPSFGPDAPNELGKFDEVKRITEGALYGSRADWKNPKFKISDDLLYRPMFYEDKKSQTPEQLERGVRYELSRRLKDTLVYTCELRGHRDPKSGAVYAVDTIAEVKDQVEDVNERLWCLERTFENQGQGPRTTLQFVRPGAIAL